MTDENISGGIDAGDILKTAKHLTRWKTYVIYLLVASLSVSVVANLWQRGTNSGLETKLAEKDAELQAAKTRQQMAEANERSCKASIATSNEIVARENKRFIALQKEMAELQRKIDSGEFYKDADDARKQPTPKDCQETLDFFNRNT